MSGFQSVVTAIDDRINPIMVKELRQVVRGKFFWSVLLLFLGFQCMVLTFSIANERVVSASSGSQTMYFLLYVLSFSSMMLIPLYTGFRFASESREGSDELLFITTITPQSIIWGKFSASMSIVLLLYSAFVPFMTLTFFLSGVDPALTAILLSFSIILSAASIMFQICLGALARDNSATSLLKGFAFVSQMILFFSTTSVFSELVRYGISRIFGTSNELKVALTIAGVIIGIGIFCYYAAAGIISASGTNRTGDLRKFSTVFWFLSLFVALYWTHKFGSLPPVMIWAYLMANWICLLCLIAVSERDCLSRRLSRKLRPGLWGRRLDLLFTSGAAGGLIWSSLLFFATIAIAFVSPEFFRFSPGHTAHQSSEFYAYIVATPLYVISYSLLATFIRRNFLDRLITARNTWVLVLLLTAFMAFMPVLIEVFSPMASETLKLFSYLSMMGKTHPSGIDGSVTPGLMLFLFALALNLQWLKRQVFEIIYSPSASESHVTEQRELIND